MDSNRTKATATRMIELILNCSLPQGSGTASQTTKVKTFPHTICSAESTQIISGHEQATYSQRLCRPRGTCLSCYAHPALKRWAIFFRPAPRDSGIWRFSHHHAEQAGVLCAKAFIHLLTTLYLRASAVKLPLRSACSVVNHFFFRCFGAGRSSTNAN